ncbi:hypothetical protein ABZW30_46060 [Kitasatospora sp. NPDC004669]|uniref:hypothetical protein n=1 Tax=Kitasatospora sp. NPDC004669 TaxID=3154555 RepID=UPI0033B452F6
MGIGFGGFGGFEGSGFEVGVGFGGFGGFGGFEGSGFEVGVGFGGFGGFEGSGFEVGVGFEADGAGRRASVWAGPDCAREVGAATALLWASCGGEALATTATHPVARIPAAAAMAIPAFIIPFLGMGCWAMRPGVWLHRQPWRCALVHAVTAGRQPEEAFLVQLVQCSPA